MTTVSVETEIHDRMSSFTAAEKRAARALIANYPALGLAPVVEFADAAATSPASVLRFVAQLGFSSYPEFQRRLREELDERIKSPLQKLGGAGDNPGREDFLQRFATRTIGNINETVARLPSSEFASICVGLANDRTACHIAGGRFTGPIAAYLTAHSRIIRSGVRLLDSRAASRSDELLDVKAGDIAIILDIRRYDDELLRLAKLLRLKRARVILITDSWISPVSRYAKFVLPCSVDMRQTWDSSAALFVIAEAIIARVTELNLDDAQARIAAKESLDK